jgi:hypothetical protein
MLWNSMLGPAVVALTVLVVQPAQAALSCTDDDVQEVIDTLNGGNHWRSLGISIIDFDGLTTVSYSEDTGEFTCHVTMEFNDGEKVNGVATKHSSHNGFVVGFKADRAHLSK